MTTRARPVAHEHHEQVMLVQRLQLDPFWRGVAWWAVPNGGHRHVATAGRLKAEGVRAGVPDLTVALARTPFSGLFLELKAPVPVAFTVSLAQRAWHTQLRDAGYCVMVARGAEAAWDGLEWYRRSAWRAGITPPLGHPRLWWLAGGGELPPPV